LTVALCSRAAGAGTQDAPHERYAERLFTWINETFPHPGHKCARSEHFALQLLVRVLPCCSIPYRLLQVKVALMPHLRHDTAVD
jgi:hypothetical protein